MSSLYFRDSWKWLIDWTIRMAKKYPGWSYPSENAIEFGQGICREMYGKDWMNHPKFRTENDKDPETEDVDPSVIDRAKRWEAGEIPEWCSE